MLAANPDIDIMFAANDGGTIGAVMAVEMQDRQARPLYSVLTRLSRLWIC